MEPDENLLARMENISVPSFVGDDRGELEPRGRDEQQMVGRALEDFLLHAGTDGAGRGGPREVEFLGPDEDEASRREEPKPGPGGGEGRRFEEVRPSDELGG